VESLKIGCGDIRQLHRRRRCVCLTEWVPPVGGAPSGHTSTWEVQAAGDTQARSSGAPNQAAGACVVKQPRRRAGPAEQVRTGGAKSPDRKVCPDPRLIVYLRALFGGSRGVASIN
jgi:hypothetical protein